VKEELDKHPELKNKVDPEEIKKAVMQNLMSDNSNNSTQVHNQNATAQYTTNSNDSCNHCTWFDFAKWFSRH
jgi:hypothetical protein